MPDFHSAEDEATLYVLGELTAAERREFEARMAKSAELRQMVRDLEEGVVVLSAGLPRRRPPSEIWSGIEKAVGRQRQPEAVPWWKTFWRNGWAAAALCVLGWLLYAILLNGHNSVKTTTTQAASAHEAVVVSASPAPQQMVSLPRATNGERQLLQVRAEEISDLRLRLAAVTQETNDLSQLLAQERARLSETNRIKFYQFASASASNGDATAPQLSPVMQRAMLISIGRELGLLPMAAKSRVGNASAANTIGGIDFVDLRPPTSNPNNQQPATQSSGQTANQQLSQPQTDSQTADVTEPSVPAFASGDKLVVGLDPSIVPTNSAVTLSVAGNAGVRTASWDFTMGENPTMVTIPLSTATSFFGTGGFMLTVSSVTASGISNSSQFFTPISP